jgi:hypothetical protein
MRAENTSIYDWSRIAAGERRNILNLAILIVHGRKLRLVQILKQIYPVGVIAAQNTGNALTIGQRNAYALVYQVW